jgi:ribonucleotide reductase alpha subunit
MKLSDNALQVAQSRYFMEGENWQKCAERVASVVSMPETNKRQEFQEAFASMIYNMDFLPGGRILRNCGRPRGSLFNCYHLPVGDSIEEIGQLYKDALTLWSEGGGVGVNFTPLRPKNDPIFGKGGKSSGLVSFMKGANFISQLIESGGSRRAAAIGHIDVSHPELMDFIDAKLLKPDVRKWLKDDTPPEIIQLVKDKIEKGDLNHFNISVVVNHDFLEKVERDQNWTFKFKQKSYGTVRARDIWNKIIDNMVKCGEPGLINWSNFAKNNSYYFEPVTGTNPCHTGDSLVSVADGRKLVSFRQLAEENKDVPVFSKNDITGLVEVKMMRRPRKTGKQVKIYKVILDNGMSFRCNNTHKVSMFDGSTKCVADLKENDRLHHMVKYISSMNPMNINVTSSGDYVWINTGFGKNYAEHRIVAEHIIGRPLHKNEIVHHINYIHDDNEPNNLQVMEKEEHDKFHSADMKGENNPMNRFPEKNHFRHVKYTGIKNGNSKGYTLNEIEIEALLLCKELNRKPTIDEWKEYCETKNLPFWSADVLKTFKSIGKFLEYVCTKNNIKVYNGSVLRSYKKYLEIKKETDLNVFFDNGIKVRKVCEGENCNNEIVVPWDLRERCFCSIQCFNTSDEKRNSLIGNKHAVGQNFKVVSVIEDGYEDVYNGTVDDNHNYYVYVGEDTTKNGKPKSHFINSRNCGETTLGPYGVCDLGSLVLPNFITGNINTNWKKLESVIKLAVRFLDNVIEVNKYVLQEIDINAHKSRRIGIGVIGLAEYLFAKKVRYGSEKAVVETERLMQFIRNAAYKASNELAIEKGAFPQFDPIQYGKASFIRKLPASLRMDIKKYGIRNCTLMALAPTGCLHKETEILTKKGVFSFDEIFKQNGINLEDYKNNKNIWFTPSKNIEVKNRDGKYRKITKLYINGVSHVKQITFENNEKIIGTCNHKILVLTNKEYKWKRLDELIVGDKIVLKNLKYKIRCELCGKKVYSLTSHLKQHNITKEEYIRRFPNCELLSDKTRDILIRKYGYNNIFTEKFNNWKQSISKTRKKNKSGSLDYFIKKYGQENGTKQFDSYVKKVVRTQENFINQYGEVDGEKRFKIFIEKSKQTEEKFIEKYGEEDGKNLYKEYVIRKTKNTPFFLDYWINLFDGNIEKAKKEYINFQTKDLEFFINKYGNVEGLKRYNQRCKKVRQWTVTRPFFNYSKVSQDLFNELLKFNFINKTNVFFAEHNGEKNIEYLRPDFVYKNKIIEFFGDYYHCNPTIYNENFLNTKVNKCAKEIWEDDTKRINLYLKKGYDVLIIWEKDYFKNSDNEIKKCKKFLKE